MFLTKLVRNAVAVAVVLAAPLAAFAQPYENYYFGHKAWTVHVVTFGDNSLACRARVSEPGTSFAIWADGYSSVTLEFLRSNWDFYEGREDIVVQIDRRASWDLTDADLSGDQILFQLPGGNASDRFLDEIVRGNQVKLYSNAGEFVEGWSLAGSAASIDKLIECTRRLR
ncbi:hypothetical protein [Aliiroseovarius sp.]|uniref:hypothetical protein n=1 Tax=Aliiroseovarius sp. TaxID=1872442 RepID=UPI002624C6BD|nr:hypothetical protein [Aliiroseovarius sp.]